MRVETYRAPKPVRAPQEQQAQAPMMGQPQGELPEGHPPIGGDAQNAPQAQAAPQAAAPAAPMMGGGSGMGNGAVSAVSASELKLQWSLPQGWVEQAGANSIRLATFMVEGSHTASIVALGGDAGGLVANVNRWRGQVGLPAADDASVMKSAKKAKGKMGEFQWFEIINDSNPNQAMLVALMPVEGMTVFVKLSAPAGALKKQQAKFLSFCQSLKRA